MVVTDPPQYSAGSGITLSGATGVCDSLSVAEGQDVKCTNAVGKYIAIYNYSDHMLRIKNLAIYAGYDCYRAKWRLIETASGNDAATMHHIVGTGVTTFMFRAVIDTSQTSHANEKTLTRECAVEFET